MRTTSWDVCEAEGVFLRHNPIITYKLHSVTRQVLLPQSLVIKKPASPSMNQFVVLMYSFSKANAQKRSVNLQLIVNLLRKAGANQIITLEMDFFDGQRQLNSPVENLRIDAELCSWFRNNFSDLTDHCFVSLRETTSDRARNLSKSLDCGFGVFRTTFLDSESGLSGNSAGGAQFDGCIEGKTAVLIEGFSDDCYCLCEAAKSLSEMGARAVYAVCIHGAFTEDGLHRISDSPIITTVTTNSIDQSENLKKCPKLWCLDVSNRFASAIARIHNSTSENHVTGSDDTTPLNGDNGT
ncbi:hypothetical protein AAHC03_09267 [Spirometra sp. Aus1]